MFYGQEVLSLRNIEGENGRLAAEIASETMSQVNVLFHRGQQPRLVIIMTPFVATIANFVAQIWHGYAMLITCIGEI